MPSVKDRTERIDQLYKEAQKAGLTKDSYDILGKLRSMAQASYLVSSPVARDYALVVLAKLGRDPVQDPGPQSPKPVGSSASG